MSRSLTLLILLGFSVFDSGCAARRSHDYVFSVTGVVKTEDDEPVQDAEVTLEENGPVYQAVTLVKTVKHTTNDTGGFVFAYLSHKLGVNYAIRVQKEGFEPATVSGSSPPPANHVIRLRKGGDQSPRISCLVTANDVNWRQGSATGEVSATIQFEGAAEISVMPSINLVALPKGSDLRRSEYWAPFDLVTGASTRERQNLTPVSEVLSVRLVPARLLWAPAISSVWPSQTFAKTVPPGRYSLQVQLEFDAGKTILSNEVEIAIR